MLNVAEAMEAAAGCLRAGQLTEARQAYTQVLQSRPNHPLALHWLGVIAHQRGKSDKAAELIGKAIANNPRIPQFHNTLGIVYEALGRGDEAIDAYRHAVLLKPDFAEPYNNMAIVLQSQGRYPEAVQKCKKAISLAPDYAQAYNTMGYALQMQGNFAEAAESYAKAVQLKPDFVKAYNHLGVVLSEQEKYDQAIENYNQALAIDPNYAEVYNNLGIALRAKEQLDQAVENYQRAIALEPDFPEAYYNLANVLKEQQRYDEAIANCEEAIRLKPDYAEAYNQLGIVLNEQGKSEQAIENHRHALQLKPDSAEFYSNLGIALKSTERFDEAFENYRRAIDLDPQFHEAYYNLANALQEEGNCTEAIENFRRAVDLKPDYASAHWNLALALLANEEFEEGWKKYKWRRNAKLESILYLHRFKKPRWDGSSFPGKRLFVHYEQGLGDNMQFLRYLPMVKARGGTVIFETLAQLHGLLRGFDYIDELIESSLDGTPPNVEFDFYVSLLDMPSIFGTTIETVPAEVPYLWADSDRTKYWQQRLSDGHFKVGIVWAGSVEHKNDHNRSCRLEHFAPLAQIEGVCLYGLQKGPAAGQVEEIAEKMPIENLGQEFLDFCDTAGAVENMDLVISVDTSVLHLAGAMGKPVWALLPFAAEWRWMLKRQDSPWYPTMKLFRQKTRGDWNEVFERMAGELRKLTGEQR